MTQRKFLLLYLNVIALLIIVRPVFAVTFTDDFEDATFTNVNWSVFLESWEVKDGSYRGTAGPVNSQPDHENERATAATFADSGTVYVTNYLYINTFFTMETNDVVDPNKLNPRHTAEVLFSFNDYGDSLSLDSAQFIYNRWGLVYESPTTSFNLSVGGIEIYTEGSLADFGFESEEDLFDSATLGIQLLVADEKVIASLYEMEGSFYREISTLVLENANYSDYGKVGLSTNSDVAFHSFTVTGNTAPVPEPSTITLIGIGLIGLVGASRKKL